MSLKHIATYDSDQIHCPHCRANQGIELEFIDGEEHECECEMCGEKYTVRVDRPIVVDIFIEEEEK
jgi:hypothetical protein